MNLPETMRFLAMVKSQWPDRFHPDDLTPTTWAATLANVALADAIAAMVAHAAISQHPLTAADVTEWIASQTSAAFPTAGEAWAEVRKAVSSFGINRPPGQRRSGTMPAPPVPDIPEPETERGRQHAARMAELGQRMATDGSRRVQFIEHGDGPVWSCDPIGRTVDSIGWRELCLAEKPDVIRRQFMDVYEAIVKRAVVDQRIGIGPGDHARVLGRGESAALVGELTRRLGSGSNDGTHEEAAGGDRRAGSGGTGGGRIVVNVDPRPRVDDGEPRFVPRRTPRRNG
jgi:hypothetical protein